MAGDAAAAAIVTGDAAAAAIVTGDAAAAATVTGDAAAAGTVTGDAAAAGTDFGFTSVVVEKKEATGVVKMPLEKGVVVVPGRGGLGIAAARRKLLAGAPIYCVDCQVVVSKHPNPDYNPNPNVNPNPNPNPNPNLNS